MRKGESGVPMLSNRLFLMRIFFIFTGDDGSLLFIYYHYKSLF